MYQSLTRSQSSFHFSYIPIIVNTDDEYDDEKEKNDDTEWQKYDIRTMHLHYTRRVNTQTVVIVPYER